MTINDLRKKVTEILESFDVTEFEAMQIAVQVQKNELYAKANVITTNNTHPTALEKIGMELSDIASAIANANL